MNRRTCSSQITRRLAVLIVAVVSACAAASSVKAQDDSIVGRWEFPMGQVYTFTADGTFSAPMDIHGEWKNAGMGHSGGDAFVKYHLFFYSQSGRLSEKPEVLTLIRGDREGHEYESGHVLRLGQQMRVKKLAERAGDDFSHKTDSRSTETRPSHRSSEVEYNGNIGFSPAVFRLTTENEKVTGTYSQGDKTYRLVGRYENEKLLLDEYTGERVTAHIKLTPIGSDGGWKGTMYNVYPDKKQYPVSLSKAH
jgi:hypothetical protein